MEKLMKAICLTPDNSVKLQDVPKPEKAEEGHLLIKMEACGINAGDNAFIGGAFPKGSIPVSQYEIAGVSGVGTVIAIGAGVSKEYTGKKVAIYRSLKFSESIIGTWCEYAHLHSLHCAVLPDNVDAVDYTGSLVNIITPYAFLKQITEEGTKVLFVQQEIQLPALRCLAFVLRIIFR
jgi:NADPH:quinone reductase